MLLTFLLLGTFISTDTIDKPLMIQGMKVSRFYGQCITLFELHKYTETAEQHEEVVRPFAADMAKKLGYGSVEAMVEECVKSETAYRMYIPRG